MKILLGTHEFHLHLLDYDPATSSIKKVGSIKLKEQPSFTLRHPTLRGLWYVTAWVDSVVYVVRVDAEQGKSEVLKEAKSGGGGPTFFTLTDDGESLLIANVSSLSDIESRAKILWTVSVWRSDSAWGGSEDWTIHVRCRGRGGRPCSAVF
jgi:6-phosphogluconolactonase (cycloisomerase 2 family)